MPWAIRLERTRAPDVLQLNEVDSLAPGPNEAWIEHEAIGVNYLDVMQRNGASPMRLVRWAAMQAGASIRPSALWRCLPMSASTPPPRSSSRGLPPSI